MEFRPGQGPDPSRRDPPRSNAGVARAGTAPTASRASTGWAALDVQNQEATSSDGRPVTGRSSRPKACHGAWIRQRSGRRAAPAAWQGAACRCNRWSDSSSPTRRRPSARHGGDGHRRRSTSRRARATTRSRTVRAAGRCRAAERLSARALSRQGDAGRATLPDGTAKAAAARRAMGFPLAAGLPLGRRRSRLPRGTTMAMRYTYDNSDENDEQPARNRRGV